MHCPNCGKAAEAEQQFCRTCGMSLEGVGKLVAQHSSLPLDQKKIDKAELDQAIVRKMLDALTRGMIVLGIGLVMLVLNKYFDIGRWFGLLSVVLLLGGMAVATAGVLNALRQGASISGKRRAREISAAPEAKSIAASSIPAALPSVTERTTQLIPADDTRAKSAIDTNGRNR